MACGYAERTDNGSTQALGKELPGAAEVLFVYSPFTLSERREWRHERQTGKRHGPCSRRRRREEDCVARMERSGMRGYRISPRFREGPSGLHFVALQQRLQLQFRRHLVELIEQRPGQRDAVAGALGLAVGAAVAGQPAGV